MTVRSQLIEILSEQGSLSEEDLSRAVHLHLESGGSFAEVLISEGLMDEEDLYFLMSRRLGVPAIPEARLQHLTIAPEIRRRVPRSLARDCVLVPVDLDPSKGLLSVVMFDPTDWSTLEMLRKTSRVGEIRCYLGRRSSILRAISDVYSDEDEHSDVSDLVDLPAPDDAQDQAPARERIETERDDASPFAPKVEIDPALAEEIAALRHEDELVPASVESPLPSPPLSIEVIEVPESEAVEEADFSEGPTSVRQIKGHSLLRRGPEREVEEEVTNPFGLLIVERDLASGEEYHPGEDDEESNLEREPTKVTKADDVTPPYGTQASPSLPDVREMEDLDSLLRELLSSVGVLVSMLEERIDPAGGSYREFGRVGRLVARELGMDELAVARISLAAHLYGLDISLRREVGMSPLRDVRSVFSIQPTAPGGLGPSLRLLGYRALGLSEQETAGSQSLELIQLIADYLDLCAESEQDTRDAETVVQLLRTGGSDPMLIDALVRTLEIFKEEHIRLKPGSRESS